MDNRYLPLGASPLSGLADTEYLSVAQCGIDYTFVTTCLEGYSVARGTAVDVADLPLMTDEAFYEFILETLIRLRKDGTKMDLIILMGRRDDQGKLVEFTREESLRFRWHTGTWTS